MSDVGIVDEENSFKCVKCKNEGFEYVLMPNEEKEQIFIKFNAIQNCDFYDTTDQLLTSSLKCLQCRKNEINYLTVVDGIQQCLIRTQVISGLKLTDCDKFDPVHDDCTSCKTGYHIITETTQNLKRCTKNPQDCLTYDVVNSKCLQCVDNFTMTLVDSVPTCVPDELFKQDEASTPNFFPGYIHTCEPNEHCLKTYLGGLSGEVDRLFSCHVCEYDGFIPFALVRTNG